LAGEAVGFDCWKRSTPDAELSKVLKQSVEIRNPQGPDDDHHVIQNRFDLSLHGDESVHKPQQDAGCNKREPWKQVENGGTLTPPHSHSSELLEK
jgi:hypothetical protein